MGWNVYRSEWIAAHIAEKKDDAVVFFESNYTDLEDDAKRAVQTASGRWQAQIKTPILTGHFKKQEDAQAWADEINGYVVGGQ